MCGLAGVWSREASPAPPAWTAEVERMLDALRHRGPDGRGIVACDGAVVGAVRLAILDPDHGAQPMRSADGRHVVALNGAIVNHEELRTELVARGAAFRTRCDTEVLLELIARDGIAALGALNGMFAVAWLDTHTGELLLARDPCGIKPLYWTEQRGRVLFASEPKALLAADGVVARLDDVALLDHLAFQLPLDERTFFAGIRRLAPGSVLRLRRGAPPEVLPLPAWPEAPDVPTDAAAAAEALRELLRDAVRVHLRADVPLGAHLSGGVDSSLVSALAARAGARPLRVFTGAFDVPGFDERTHARAVAAELAATAHEIVPTPADLADALPRAVRAMDEPAGGPGLLPQWCVARLAARHVKVVLGGQGGDELFSGYVRHLVLHLEGALREAVHGGDTRALRRLAPHLASLDGYEPLLRRQFATGLFDDPALRCMRLHFRGEGLADVLAGDLRQAFAGHPAAERFRARHAAAAARAPGCSDVGAAVRLDRELVLPALLHVEDRTSMAWSLESRVPLLDRRVLAFVERLPDAVLLGDGELKGLLRRAAAADLPVAARARRDKMGFPVPLAAWARGPLRPFFEDLLLDRTARARGLFQPAAVERVLAGESVEARHLWALANVELWMRTFLS